MDLERFENTINDKFKNFDPEVDNTMIWDKIEGDLPSKSKRKPFWLLGLLLLPVIYFGAIAGHEEKGNTLISEISNDDLKVNDSKVKVLTTEGQKNVIPEKSNTSFSELKLNILSEDKALIESTEYLEENKIQGDLKSKSKSLKTSNLASSQTRPSPTNQLENSNQNVNSASATFAQANKQSEQSETEVKENVSKELLSLSESKSNVKEKDKNIPIEQTEQRLILPSETTIEKQLNEKADNRKDLSADAENQKVQLFDDSQKTKEKVSTPMALKEGKESKIQETKVKPKASISFTTGISMANRIYDSSSDPELARIIAEKETVEKQLEMIQFDLQYKYYLSNKFAIGLGLRQWRHSESSSYIIERESESTIDVVTCVTHHPDGTTDETLSSVPIYINEKIEQSRYQTHASWSIPVKFYYTLNSTNKIRTEIGFGYEYSFSGKHTGYELDQDQTEYFVTLDQDKRYANSGGSFLLANINASYRINNSFQFTAGLEGKYGLNGFNTASTIYRKTYHFLGLYF